MKNSKVLIAGIATAVAAGIAASVREVVADVIPVNDIGNDPHKPRTRYRKRGDTPSPAQRLLQSKINKRQQA